MQENGDIISAVDTADRPALRPGNLSAALPVDQESGCARAGLRKSSVIELQFLGCPARRLVTVPIERSWLLYRLCFPVMFYSRQNFVSAFAYFVLEFGGREVGCKN
jgi:hypothetical protein